MRGHLVAPFGVSGDLLLGCLVDVGAPLETLQAAVDATGVGPIRLEGEVVHVRGVTATRVTVTPEPSTPRVETWADAERALAGLEAGVRDRATAAYRALADAEARAHGTSLDEVRFHELGDPDTLADIVGAAAGLAALGIEVLTCGPVAVGGGVAEGDHGALPVPPPAVLELLRGFEIVAGGDRELATPTGAAILAALATPITATPPLRLTSHGRGAGNPSWDPPSLLTLLVGESTAGELAAGDPPPTLATVLEATVDDLVPTLVPVVLDRLRDAGAHDAWATPVLMKKGRPGYTLTALTDDADLPHVIDVLFTESTTIGLRWHHVSKLALDRRTEVVTVDGHDVRVKVAERDGHVISATPEFDDVLALAEKLGQPVADVLQRAQAAARPRR